MNLGIRAVCLPQANSSARLSVAHASWRSSSRRRFHGAALFFAAVVALVAFPRNALAQTYADGLVHTISTGGAFLYFKDGPNSAPTTGRVITPANVSFLEAQEHSILEVLGGSVSHLITRNDAIAKITGGNISHVRINDNGRATISGGYSTHVSAFDHSSIDITGGWMENAGAYGIESPAGPASAPPSKLRIRGGKVDIARADYGGVVEIYGGQMIIATPSRSSIMHIFGGKIDRFSLGPDTDTFVYGSDLLLAPNGSINGTPQFILTGQLQNGSLLRAGVSYPAGARLHLITVPEPSTTALLASGVVFLALTRWRSRQNRVSSTPGGAV